MATVNANTCALYIDTAGGAFGADPADTNGATPALQAVAFSTSASISVSNATYEAVSVTDVANGTTVRDFAVGTTSTTLSVEGVLDWTVQDADAVLDLKSLFDAFKIKSEITAVWASTDDNAQAFGGKGFLTSFELSSGVDDFATYSATVELNGNPKAV